MTIIDSKKIRRNIGAALALSLSSAFAAAHEMPELFAATRIETDSGKAGDERIDSWDANGWVGSDFNRLAWKTEGEVEAGDVHDAEAQLLYSRYVAPFWDFQIGLRHDFEPASRNYLAIGMQGLAPYGFEIDIAAFVRSDGKLFMRTDFEYELLMTNRFIVSPFVLADWAATGSERDAIKGGLYSLEAGLNARYEFSRSVAPYVEVARVEQPGASADEDANYTIARAGIRLLF